MVGSRATLEKGSQLAEEVKTLPKTYYAEAKVKITEDFLSNILVTAFDANYGSCWRWCEPDEFRIEGRNHGLANGDHEDVWFSVTVINNAQDDPKRFQKKYRVDHKILMEGIKRITWTPGMRHHDLLVSALADNDAGMIDADLADMIVQLGLWREEIYS